MVSDLELFFLLASVVSLAWKIDVTRLSSNHIAVTQPFIIRCKMWSGDQISDHLCGWGDFGSVLCVRVWEWGSVRVG